MRGKPKKAVNDIAAMAGGAVSLVGGIRTQIRNEIRARMDEFFAKADMVPRADFDRLEAVLMETRDKLDALEADIKKDRTSS